MIILKKIIAALTPALLILVSSNAGAQQKEFEDKTLSPYFFVKSDAPETDRFPLKSTSSDVDISGVIADIKVTQVYKNEGSKVIEAIYVFPASTRAAVYEMKMTIGERVIKANVKKRDEARRDYEQARQQGKSASLLEQQRPNVFQMNVANIMPGDSIKVELSYTELLAPADGIYEFIYPTVVGPRYSNQPVDDAPDSEEWVRNPYLHEGEPPDYTFDITVNIAAGLPVQDVYCTSHKVKVNYDGRSIAEISLDKSEKYGGNRDYILKYRLSGGQIESGLLLYKGEKENFFLLMMQPPERVSPSRIPGREYIFIVDVSGSMHGFPLDISKKLLEDLISKLRQTDKFNVLLFAGGSSVMSESSVAATPENIRNAVNLIERQRGGGGTELLPALQRALALPNAEGYSRTIVIATDGYVTVEEQAFDLIRKNIGNANMFTFGIGSSVNRHLIEGMARVGMGEPLIITRPEESSAKAKIFRQLIQTPVLTNIEVDFGKFRTYDVEPPGIPDVMAGRPVIVFGKWRGRSAGEIKLSGISGDRLWTDVINISNVKPVKSNSALRYLWARYRIKLLSDYNMLRPDDERINEVTTLGLTYNLLTAYTSFVAVDTLVRNEDGKLSVIKQPLPLPQGVSDYAVGGVLNKKASSPYSLRQRFVVVKEGISDQEEVPEKEKDKGNVKIGEIFVTNGLLKKEVKKVVKKHQEEILDCYRKTGTPFTVKIIVDSKGNVKGAKIVSGRMEAKSVKKCILRQIEKWQFPWTHSGRDITVTVMFEFKM
jgi:Ca-activated chloride channel family protein